MKNTLESATARAQTPFQNQPFIDFSKEENRKAQIEALEQVKSELGRKYPLIIGGEKIMNEDTFTVHAGIFHDSSTGSVLIIGIYCNRRIELFENPRPCSMNTVGRKPPSRADCEGSCW